jgi:phosphatidylglycerol:prolipoprotein diacylglycerol transferase
VHPILFRIKLLGLDFPLHTFGVLVALGSFFSILWIRREGKRRGFDPEVLMGLAVETLLVGVVGSRILFVLITPEAFQGRGWWSYFNIREGGLVWYGGFLPAALYAVLRGRHLKLPWRTVADIIAPSVMLGLAVGRIGCLMAGDDHGKIADADHWWTITFHQILGPDRTPAPPNEQPLLSDPAFFGKPLYPSQPLMSLGGWTIFAITALMRKRLADRPLALTFLMAWLYAVHRFLVEFTRGDSIRKFVEFPLFGQLSTSQAIGIPIFIVFFALWVRIMLRPPAGIEPPPKLEPEEKKAEAKPA